MPASSSTSWTSTTATDPHSLLPMAAAGCSSPIHSSSSTASRGAVMIKGKRTKRRRMLNHREQSLTPPPPATPPPEKTHHVSPASSSSTVPPAPAPAYGSSSSAATAFVDEEDEDLALCLMLLAQGRTDPPATTALDMQMLAAEASPERTRKRIRRPSVLLPATSVSPGLQNGVYECRTCNKRFSSFQALGGHRTSHTKPKLTPPPLPPPVSTALQPQDYHILPAAHPEVRVPTPAPADNVSTSSSPSLTAHRQQRPHLCSICGAEFSSGQALGGHMRRHRPLNGTTPAESTSAGPHHDAVVHDHDNTEALISLDLNLPAPLDADDHARKGFVTDDNPPLPVASRFPLVAGKSSRAVFASSSSTTPLLLDRLPLLT